MKVGPKADYASPTSPEQARVAQAISSRYVVTPNQDRGGHDERFEWDPGSRYGPHIGVVFYVNMAEFDRYSEELTQLAKINMWSTIPKYKVSELRSFEVIGFIERRVLSSGWLEPDHAALLCITPGRSTTLRSG